jgi:hypothetical protein
MVPNQRFDILFEPPSSDDSPQPFDMTYTRDSPV